jgi:quercetin dioxygenase-like cupin family protein
MNSHLVEFNDIPWDTPARGVKVKSLVRGDKRLRLVEFTHEFTEPDWCTKGHVGLVLEGEVAININGVVQNFKTGDGLVIPSGEQSRHKHHDTIKPTRLFLVEEA